MKLREAPEIPYSSALDQYHKVTNTAYQTALEAGMRFAQDERNWDDVLDAADRNVESIGRTEAVSQGSGELVARHEVELVPAESDLMGKMALAENAVVYTPTVAELGDMMLQDVTVEDIPVAEMADEATPELQEA